MTQTTEPTAPAVAAPTPTPAGTVRALPRYPAYRESGVPWLGAIPAHWEIKRLKHVAHLAGEKLEEKPDDLLYLGLENIESQTGRLLLDATQEEVESTVTAFQEGDVLFGKLRPYLAKVALTSFRGVCSTEILVLRPRAQLEARYLAYRLLSDDFIRLVDSLTYGTKMPRANGEQIGAIKLGIPPLAEQRAIAAFLDRETARIDALMAAKRRLIELLREKRAALISRAVTHGLDASVPLRESGVPWLGAVPAHWEVIQLRRLAAPDTSITYGIVQAGPDIEGGIPYIRTSDMAGDHLPENGYLRTSPDIDRQYQRSKVLANDLVVAIRATVGKTLRVPPYLDGANLTQGTARISPGPRVLGNFLLNVMQSPVIQQRFEALSKGATFKEITLDMLRRLSVPVPPLDEQWAIAAYLDAETAKLDTLAGRIEQQIARLREYRTALIAAAVTGAIDVRGQAAGDGTDGERGIAG